MTKFIVISGKKQSGKTTSAGYLKSLLEHLGWSVCITSFATPIKEFCTDILGLTREQVYGTEEQKNTHTHIKWDTMPKEIRKRYGRQLTEGECLTWGGFFDYDFSSTAPAHGLMTAREVMQILGTDIFRNFFDYDIWAKAPFRKFANIKDDQTLKTYDFVIIDDCRFPNEAKAAKDNGAPIIRLKRDVLGKDQHISEKAMDDYPDAGYDFIIYNQDVPIESLYSSLRKFAKRYE